MSWTLLVIEESLRITLILIGISARQFVCLFDIYLSAPFHLVTEILLRDVSVTRFIRSSNFIKFSCTNKTKVLAEVLTSLKQKEVYHQLSFERYKGKLVLHF